MFRRLWPGTPASNRDSRAHATDGEGAPLASPIPRSRSVTCTACPVNIPMLNVRRRQSLKSSCRARMHDASCCTCHPYVSYDSRPGHIKTTSCLSALTRRSCPRARRLRIVPLSALPFLLDLHARANQDNIHADRHLRVTPNIGLEGYGSRLCTYTLQAISTRAPFRRRVGTEVRITCVTPSQRAH